MLRISINDSETTVYVSLEGWLIGPWVDELRKQSERVLAAQKSLTLDLAKLWFVDPGGIALLHELSMRHVPQVNCSAFISQQLKETLR